MEDKTYIILGVIYLVIAIVLVVAALVLLNKHTRKKLEQILINLEINKNLIISGNILTELNKVGSLINNKKLEERYNNWKERYKQIKDVDIPLLDNKLNDLDSLIKDKKYKEFAKESSDLELEIYYTKSKCDFLLNEIREITLSESKNREIVTNLKKVYREVYLKYNDNKGDYEGLNNTIELQFENIDKLFNSFEITMENNDYSEAPKIVKALSDNIGNMEIIINDASSIILMGKKLIPSKIDNIKEIYDRMTKEGYLLDYLNIDYNIQEAEKKIADVFDRLKVLNVNDSVIELKTILDYFESLYSDFDKEKDAKKNYEKLSHKIAIKNKKLSAVIKNILSKIDEIKYSYDLSDEDILGIDELNLSIKNSKNDYEIIVEKFRGKSFSYSQLYKELELINNRLLILEEKVEQTLKFLSSLKEDEVRAREQLEEIKSILESSKEKMESFKLPVIPSDYYVELSEAVDAIENMATELKKKPIHKWQKENKRYISITGMRKEEGGNRAGIKGCILTNKKGNIVKFHPLLVVNDDFENWFINKYNIELCKLYREPFNFKRTGCKGCPFSLDLQEQLDTMAMYLPSEKKQCEMIWKPVYQEYRRLGYRLRKDKGQMSIFDFVEKGE